MPSIPSREPGKVRAMFSAIAPRYDLLNRILSFNLDRRWRRRAARELPADRSARVLDLCGGTGDLSVAVARGGRAGLVVCCDFAPPMLSRAAAKFRRTGLESRCAVLAGDGLRLPFAPASFDAVTVGFGIRNFADLDAGVAEILRVLRPGGRLVVLEFSAPEGRGLSFLYSVYLHRVLPRVGDAIAGRAGPYRYLARTIAGFPDAAGLAGRLRDAGFAAVGWVPLTGGIVCVHTAIKEVRPHPAAAGGSLFGRGAGFPPAGR